MYREKNDRNVDVSNHQIHDFELSFGHMPDIFKPFQPSLNFNPRNYKENDIKNKYSSLSEKVIPGKVSLPENLKKCWLAREKIWFEFFLNKLPKRVITSFSRLSWKVNYPLDILINFSARLLYSFPEYWTFWASE